MGGHVLLEDMLYRMKCFTGGHVLLEDMSYLYIYLLYGTYNLKIGGGKFFFVMK